MGKLLIGAGFWWVYNRFYQKRTVGWVVLVLPGCQNRAQHCRLSKSATVCSGHRGKYITYYYITIHHKGVTSTMLQFFVIFLYGTTSKQIIQGQIYK